MRDARRAPFCYQTLACTTAIREHFDGKRLTVALAIYQAMTEIANEQRSRDGFEASRAQVARYAGVSDRTVDVYAEELAELGLLEVTRRRHGQVNLPNLWTLLEPGGGEANRTPIQEEQHQERARSASRGTRQRGAGPERHVRDKLIG